jgi:hypothetical protein
MAGVYLSRRHPSELLCFHTALLEIFQIQSQFAVFLRAVCPSLFPSPRFCILQLPQLRYLIPEKLHLWQPQFSEDLPLKMSVGLEVVEVISLPLI